MMLDLQLSMTEKSFRDHTAYKVLDDLASYLACLHNVFEVCPWYAFCGSFFELYLACFQPRSQAKESFDNELEMRFIRFDATRKLTIVDNQVLFVQAAYQNIRVGDRCRMRGERYC